MHPNNFWNVFTAIDQLAFATGQALTPQNPSLGQDIELAAILAGNIAALTQYLKANPPSLNVPPPANVSEPPVASAPVASAA